MREERVRIITNGELKRVNPANLFRVNPGLTPTGAVYAASPPPPGRLAPPSPGTRRPSHDFEDDNFTPSKHLTPPPDHSSRPAAAHNDTETPRVKLLLVDWKLVSVFVFVCPFLCLFFLCRRASVRLSRGRPHGAHSPILGHTQSSRKIVTAS